MAGTKKRKSSRTSTTVTRRGARSAKLETKDDENERLPSSLSPSLHYKLLMILSPAKTLNLKDDVPEEASEMEFTKPLEDLKSKRTEVVTAMKQHASSVSKLGALLKTSHKIASAAQEYWQDMSEDAAGSGGTQKPSIFLFNGAAYSGLDIPTMATKANLEYLQRHLRIVDPLYGWLRPMDEVQAYRLEMASKGVFSKTKGTNDDDGGDSKKEIKLEDYWKSSIRACIGQEEQGDDDVVGSSPAAAAPIVIVNLASDEYSAAVDVPTRHMVKVVFKHGGRTIAVHAKRARGLMVRYMAMNAVEFIDQLLDFDLEGYTFRSNESTYEKGMGEDYFSIAAFGSLQQQGEEEEYLAKKQKTKKAKEQPLTVVFDRPGTWKRPKK